MSDLISRKAAIDALTETEVVGVCWKGGYIQRHNDFHEAINCIKELPSAEPRWIPVTEQLPKEKGLYLVTYHPCYWDVIEEEKTIVGIDSFRGKSSWAHSKYQRVTAWKPMPEPYQEIDREK